ncbi:5704_t:CDS:2, partial [Ambispora leptoticha]
QKYTPITTEVDIPDEILCDFFAEPEQLNKFERFDPGITGLYHSYCVICGKTFHESIECQETTLQDFELNAVDDTKELVDALNQHTTRKFDIKLGEALATNTKILRSNISYNEITPKVVSAMIKTLKTKRTLKNLMMKLQGRNKSKIEINHLVNLRRVSEDNTCLESFSFDPSEYEPSFVYQTKSFALYKI